MKKMFKYASLGAIALVGAISFSACSSSDEIVDNPDYNPVDNTVNTQIAFSLSKGGAKKAATRQTAEIVQNGQNHDAFRGMTKMSLIPFGGAIISASSSPLGPVIGPLTMDLSSTASSTASSYNNTDNDAVVYTNIQVPNNTSLFLFYGQATDKTGSGIDNHDNGTLAVTGLYGATDGTYSFTTPNSISFAPVPIYDANKTTEIGVGTSLIDLLNSLLTATDGGTTPKKWGEYTAEDNALLNGLYNNYKALTTASSYSVAAMLVDLYASLEGLANTAEGTVGKAMATSLRSAIAAGFTDANVTESKIIAAGYPGNLGLPDGAARLSFDATNGFSLAADPSQTGNFPTGVSITKYNDYVYPANLQYFVNSPIKVSNVQQSSNFSGKTTWTACTNLYTNGTAVTSSTKSIALTNEIQYGVGNLKIVVNPLTETTYYDRNAEAIDISSATPPFTLTGVLVGSQGQVGWNFVPASQGSKTIYDNKINSAPLSASASPNNFTLGLETVEVPATSDGTTGVVYIALELQNNTGKDFMGKDGLIPAGGKFYLAGKLDPSATATIGTNTDNVKSVFKQDYLTTANLTIKAGTLGEDSDGDGKPDNATDGFAEATNGIPDLRTPQSEVCFSVNLQWKAGIEFNVTF